MYYIYEYFISFILAFIVAFAATPIAKKIAFRVGAVDIPKDNRRMHKKPIARLGGLAIVSGFLVSLLFSLVSSAFSSVDLIQLTGLLSGIVIIVFICIIDDIKSLSARYKLVFQLIAACIVVLAGTRIQYVTNPFSSLGISQLSPYISYPLTIFWIIGITNAINFIDGLDGLAAGVSSISALSLFLVSIIFERWDVAIITAALAGSTLGFLPYNFNPAKIFMGDTGSNFLGFTLGVISIQGTLKAYAAIAIAIPLLVLGLPLFDTIFAIIRRLLKKKSIMEADRGHLHHRLIDMGLTQKQSVIVMYTVSGALGLCAIVLADKGALSAIIVVISVSVFIVGGARFMSVISSDEPDEADTGSEHNLDTMDTKVSGLGFQSGNNSGIDSSVADKIVKDIDNDKEK